MAGSSANRNRCLSTTKKTAGAATTNKRVVARGGNNRPPSPATRAKGTSVGGAAAASKKKLGGSPEETKANECKELLPTCKKFEQMQENLLCTSRVVFTTIKKKRSGFFSKDEVIGYVLTDGSIVSKDPSIVGERNTQHEKCL